jgi:hypothetical protein
VLQVVAKLGLKVKLLSVAPNSTPATNDRPEIKRLAFVFEYSGEPDQQDVAAVGTHPRVAVQARGRGRPSPRSSRCSPASPRPSPAKPEAKLEDLVAYMAPEQTTIPGVDLAAGPRSDRDRHGRHRHRQGDRPSTPPSAPRRARTPQ